MIHQHANQMIKTAGWLIVMAVFGGTLLEPLWWLLAPAAILLGAGLIGEPWFASRGVSRIAGRALAAAISAIVVYAAVSAVTELRLGVEPPWLDVFAEAAAVATVVGALLLGAALVATRQRTNGAAVLIALALPAGMTIDGTLSVLLPPGFVFHGAGFYLGTTGFALALMRLGTHRAPATQ